MRYRLLVAAVVVLSVTVLVFGILWRTAERRWTEAAATADEVGKIRATNSALHDSLTMLRQEVSALPGNASFWMEECSRAQRNQAMLLDEHEIFTLKQMGLSDPVNDLRRDLHAHPELIPFEGVLGGTMGFVEDRTALLSRQWVFARFEDGHIAGCCLLSYEVTPGGGISWKVLSAVLE
jgi:hypothetical protein